MKVLFMGLESFGGNCWLSFFLCIKFIYNRGGPLWALGGPAGRCFLVSSDWMERDFLQPVIR